MHRDRCILLMLITKGKVAYQYKPKECVHAEMHTYGLIDFNFMPNRSMMSFH